MLQALAYFAMFVLSVSGVIAGLPAGKRRFAGLRSAGLILGSIVLGVVLGSGFGMLAAPALGQPDGWEFVLGAAMGVTGFFAGLCTLLYRVSHDPDWRPDDPSHKPMPLAVAVGIPLCSLLAPLVLWLLPGAVLEDRGAFVVISALGGALFGALAGIVYEQGFRAFLIMVAFFGLSGLGALIALYLNGKL